MFFLRKFWKIIAIEFFLFSLTLILGIISAAKFNNILIREKVEIPQVSFWQFISQFCIVTLIIFLTIRLIKFKKQKKIVFKTLFALASLSGGMLILSIWISDIISLVLIILLVFWWWKNPSILIHNLCIILAIAGVGTFLGLSLNPETVIAFLVIFSIYDFIAVYKTKHMVKVAREMIESKAILGLVIPPNLSNFREPLKNIKLGGKFLILGGGDIAFPLLLCCSLVPFGFLKPLVVGFFSLIGLSVSFYLFLSQKKRQAFPALPPIALFSIIGFLITQFLY